MIVTTVAPGHWLDASAAASYLQMLADGCPPGITDAGRTREEQIDLFTAYYTTNYASSAKFDPRQWNGQTWWRRKNKPSAATPGSAAARHEAGLSLDLPSGGPREWVRANGEAYGWIKDLVPGEKWHTEYQAARNTKAKAKPVQQTPAAITELIQQWEDVDMERSIFGEYEKHLGRKPGRTEVNDWIDIWMAHGPAAVRIGIAGSREALYWRVHQLYIDLLGRRAEDTATMDRWLASAHGDFAVMAAGIKQSNEYAAFQAKPEAVKAIARAAALAG